MEVKHKIATDLIVAGVNPLISVMQGDEKTRIAEISLTSNGEKWNIPNGTAFSVAYRKPDGTRGVYDTLPDGNASITYKDNIVTILIAPQMLTVPGLVNMSVAMADSSMNKLHTFPLYVSVIPNPGAGRAVSEDYYWQQTLAAVGDLSKLTTAAKNSLVDAVNEINLNGTAIRKIEPAEEDIPKVFFGAALPQTKDDTVMSFRYISKTEDISGYCKTKAQGNSSMAHPKKNQTVKLYKDADCSEKLKVDFKGWGKQHKFCFKANWIDLTHARNIVSARLWGDVVKARADYDTLPEDLRNSPNQGAVDGFPVKVYAGGIYQGRYTLNIPKDAWMANMEEEQEANCILCGENYVSGCFRAEAKIDETDWTDEVHKTVPASIKNRWNDAIRFVMNSTDEEFVAGIGHYFDLPSLIDYHIFGLVTCNNDGFGKNQLYMTWDGMKWYATVYDLDNTFGTYLGSVKPYDFPRESYEDYKNGGGNLLYVRLAELFKEDIAARWEELKDGALSVENIINRFERFTDIAPISLVEEDYAATTAGGAFTGIPLKDQSNIQQIRNFAVARYAYSDYYIESLNNPQAEAIVWNDNSNVLGNGNVITESGISCSDLIDLQGATELISVFAPVQSDKYNQYRMVYYDADMKCLGYKDFYGTTYVANNALMDGAAYMRINTITGDKEYCDYITEIRSDKSIGFTALPSYAFVTGKKPSASGEEATTNDNGYFDHSIPVSPGDVLFVYASWRISRPEASESWVWDRAVYGYDADGNFVGEVAPMYVGYSQVRPWKIPEGVASVKVAAHNTASELCSYKIISA